MIGIKQIGCYIPEGRTSNLDRTEKFNTNKEFIEGKIGITEVSVKGEDEDTSDLAIKAVRDLLSKGYVDLQAIDCLILVTQNPDQNIPHTSAVVHGELEINEDCACFDISLGCSGYVYGLSVVKSMMESNGWHTGLLVTSDPYSKILDPDDKNTSLLFGDAATATLLVDKDPVFVPQKFTFGTIGKDRRNLVCDEFLYMNGRGIFNFAAKYVPKDIDKVLEKNGLTMEEVDRFIFHQGSKFIVDTLIKHMSLPVEKVSYEIHNYGNTVSSSIPLILSGYLTGDQPQNVLLCGFGVGLSWSSCILKR